MNFLTVLTALLPALQVAGPILAGLYPGLQSTLGALSGVNPATHTSPVTLIQEVLNALQAAGVVTFGAPLLVDGEFGGLTFAAIKALQAKLGFNIQEPLASIEYQLVQSLVAKL